MNEGLSKDREDGIAKCGRNMTNDFECIIMTVYVSKHREEGTAKQSKRVKCYMVYYECMCICIIMVVCI